MSEIVIAGAARTPIGSFNGALSSLPAHSLGQVAVAEAMRRARVEPSEVNEVVLGQILTAGEGQNPARQADSSSSTVCGPTHATDNSSATRPATSLTSANVTSSSSAIVRSGSTSSP